jgi:hypothetical protein
MKKQKTTPVGHHAGLQKIHVIFCGIRELTKGYGGVSLTHPSRRGSTWACEKTLIFRRKCKMKLFKKLAAAMLAAALALTMVGCGGRNSLTDQIKDVLADFIAMQGDEITYSKELDALAAKLVAEADKAAAKPENKDKTVLNLLIDKEVVKAAGIDAAQETYIVSAAENYKLLSSTANKQKAVLIAEMLMANGKQIGSGELEKLSNLGLAMGKINGKEYIVVLVN